MGTRHLIRVIDKTGTLKVAQYGQWDGYPSGQGARLIEYLHKLGLDAVEAALPKCGFITDEMLSVAEKVTLTIGDVPQLDRDQGAGIIRMITTGERVGYPDIWPSDRIWLRNETTFGQDTTFCEWLYEVDFQKRELRVKHNDATKVPMVWPLDNLPDKANFVRFTEIHFEAERAEG